MFSLDNWIDGQSHQRGLDHVMDNHSLKEGRQVMWAPKISGFFFSPKNEDVHDFQGNKKGLSESEIHPRRREKN